MEIGVSSWSFHAELNSGKLRLADVPFRVRDLGYRAVELQDMFLWPKPPNAVQRLFGRKALEFNRYQYDRKALNGVRLNRLRSGAHLTCWAIDSDLSVGDADARKKQKAYLAAAIETAHFLGAPLIRLTLGGEPNDQGAFDRAVNLMSSVLPVAMALNVKLAIENHGGLSNDAGVLAEFVQHFHSSHLGVCLDLGSFGGDPKDFPKPLESLAPHSIHVHARSHSFKPDGEEATIDYQKCLGSLKSAGYDGVLSIEYEGEVDAAVGIHRTRDLIERYW